VIASTRNNAHNLMSSHCLPHKDAKVVENQNALQPDQLFNLVIGRKRVPQPPATVARLSCVGWKARPRAIVRRYSGLTPSERKVEAVAATDN
jgi:hypothetical protein